MVECILSQSLLLPPQHPGNIWCRTSALLLDLWKAVKLMENTIKYCCFPIAAVTDYHKCSDLKEKQMYSLRVLEVRNPKWVLTGLKSRYWKSVFPGGSRGEACSAPLPTSRVWLHPLSLLHTIKFLLPSSHFWLSLCILLYDACNYIKSTLK